MDRQVREPTGGTFLLAEVDYGDGYFTLYVTANAPVPDKPADNRTADRVSSGRTVTASRITRGRSPRGRLRVGITIAIYAEGM